MDGLSSPIEGCTGLAWNEADRLAALDSFAVLDTPIEPLFDDLAALAADICEAPIAVINFIADGRQWFKAELGIGARELPLDVSICRFALLQADLLIVPDLSLDPRFADNPLVTQDGGLRFYAGVLLKTAEGLPLGTICVLDRIPRPNGLAERQMKVLSALARHVMAELEFRRARAQRDEQSAGERTSAGALEALLETQRAVEHARGDVHQVLRAIAEGALAAALAADGATVELVDGEEMVYRAVAGTSAPYLHLRIPRVGSLAGQCVAQATALNAADTETDQRVDRDACRRVGARSLLAVPLFRHGEAIGVLKLQSAQPNAFCDRELRVARLFTGVLAAGFADAAEAEAIQALRESEATFRERLNAIPQMVWSTLPDGSHDFFNDRWYEFTGVPAGSTDGDAWVDVFHEDDQPRTTARWQHSLTTGEPYEVEYRLRDRTGIYRWVLGRALPIRDTQGDIVRWMGTCTDVDAFKRTTDELVRTSALLHQIGESSPDLIYAKDRGGRFLYANAAAEKMFNAPLHLLLGRTQADVTGDPTQASTIEEHDRRVIELGETVDVDEAFTPARGRTTFLRSVKAPLRDSSGAITGLVGITSDITERREAADRERLLAREVDHRAKNLLAVVQSVVQLTGASEADLLKRAITGRIQSLARAHSLLAASRWEGVDLRQLVADELAAFSASDGCARIAIAGASVALKPTAAQALGLVLHELATNAAKYGALSVDAGRVEIDWNLEGQEGEASLTLAWIESGGPHVEAPTTTGFGSKVIRSSVERQLGGRVDLDWSGGTLHCTLTLPFDQLLLAKEETEHAVRPLALTGDPANSLPGKTVLVVEDEALIALQIQDVLGKIDCTVMGPAGTILEALGLLEQSAPDIAILDVNLGGGRSYAIADILAAKQVPFLFCTGYAGATELPLRFTGVPVLGKPLDERELLFALDRSLASTAT
jgi:PAS domain S-box-containing protein